MNSTKNADVTTSSTYQKCQSHFELPPEVLDPRRFTVLVTQEGSTGTEHQIQRLILTFATQTSELAIDIGRFLYVTDFAVLRDEVGMGGHMHTGVTLITSRSSSDCGVKSAFR